MEAASTLRTHPLVLAAAASVLILSATGTAALMGWLPATRAVPVAATEPVATAAAAPAVAPAVQPAPEVIAPVPAPKVVPQPRPVARKVVAPKPMEEPVRVAVESPPPPPVVEPAPVVSAPPVCHECGVVAAVRTIEKAGEGSGAGAVLGGVAGGAAGSQFGKGKGQIVGAVIGAVGGAIAGHQVERHVVNRTTQFEITVQLDDGTTRTIVQDTAPAWRPGDRVRVTGNEIRSAV